MKYLLPLPQDISPVNSRCVSIQVPDDPEWYSCFWGWFEEMTFAKRWNTDVQVDAFTVADRWKLIYDKARQDFDSRFCGESAPPAGCFLADFSLLDYEFSSSPGNDCASTYAADTGWQSCIWNDGVERLKIGRLFKPVGTFISQYEVGAEVGLTSQMEFNITFRLNGAVTYTETQTLLSVPGSMVVSNAVNVQADEIEIQLARNTPLTGTMTLVSLKLCYVGSFPLSMGESAPLTFQHVFDFTVGDGGWTTFNQGAVYVSGTGWRGVNAFGGWVIYIQHSLSARSVSRVEVEYSFDSTACLDNNANIAYGGQSCQDNQGGTQDGVWTCNNVLNATNIALALGSDLQGRSCSDNFTVRRVTVYGFGSDPF